MKQLLAQKYSLKSHFFTVLSDSTKTGWILLAVFGTCYSRRDRKLTLTLGGCCCPAIRVLIKSRNRSLFYFYVAVIVPQPAQVLQSNRCLCLVE